MIVNKITQNNILYIASIIPFMVFVRDVGGISISKYVFISIAILILLLSDKYTIYSFIAFLTPLSTGISYTYITSIAFVVVLFKENFHIKVDKTAFLCIITLLLLEFISFFRGYFSTLDFLRFAGVFLFSFYFIIDNDTNYNCEAIIKNFIIGYLSAIIIIFGEMLNIYSFSNILTLGIRFGETASLLNIEDGMYLSYNTNDLGALSLYTIFLSILLLKKHSIYISSFIISSIVGMMTQSRTFIITYLFVGCLYFLITSNNIKKTVQNICTICITGLLILGIMAIFLPSFLDSFILRFQDDDLSNGRIDIFLFYLIHLLNNIDQLLFGVGLQNYSDKIGFMMSAHNATQEVLITWGLSGIFILIFFFYSVLLHTKKTYKISPVQYLPTIAFFIAIQSGQGFSSGMSILVIFIVFSALCLHNKVDIQ